MKKIMKQLTAAFAIIMSLGYTGICWAQDVVAAVALAPVDPSSDVTKLVTDAVTGAKGGNWVMTVSAVIFLALSLLKNGERIPLFKLLGAHKLLAKIPGKHFALIITVLTAASATLTAVIMKQPLAMALMAGFQAGAGSAGLHEMSKNLPGIGTATKMPTGEVK
jgi:hypothetical protein